MTDDQLRDEHHYRFEERLAILCGTDEPTAQQICLAIEEAETACAKLREE